MPACLIGVSGWRYKRWRGDFYPRGLLQKDELGFVASRTTSLELNGSFYSLQRPSSYEQWEAATPPEFVFAIKGGPLHHAPEAVARRRAAAGELLRLRGAGARAQAGARAVAASAQDVVRPGQVGALPRAVARNPRRGPGAGRATRRQAVRGPHPPGTGGGRGSRAPAPARARTAARELPV